MAMDPTLIQGETAKKMVKFAKALIKLVEDRDPRNYGLMAGFPPPRDLVTAKAELELALKVATTPELREVVSQMVETLNRVEDLFQKEPRFIEISAAGGGEPSDEEEEVVVV